MSAPDYQTGDEDPPREANAPATPLAANLREATRHPDVWRMLATYSTPGTARSIAWLYRSGARTVPAGRWEFRSGRLDDGRGRVWARYLGA